MTGGEVPAWWPHGPIPEDYFDLTTASAAYSREHRRTTRHHLDLIEKYGTPHTPAEQALLGCLTALRDGGITEEWCVGEPLGTVAQQLVPDGNGVHWWGTPLPD